MILLTCNCHVGRSTHDFKWASTNGWTRPSRQWRHHQQRRQLGPACSWYSNFTGPPQTGDSVSYSLTRLFAHLISFVENTTCQQGSCSVPEYSLGRWTLSPISRSLLQLPRNMAPMETSPTNSQGWAKILWQQSIPSRTISTPSCKYILPFLSN